MLHKIIYKNFKSNIRKYILFFVSNIIAVAELFIFWGLNDVVVRAVTEPSIMMGIKSDFMIAVGLITVVTILLMVFSMRYYIKLRAKDYGTFIMLGMKKKMSYMTYLHWYDAMGEKISTTFWSYWLKLVGIYIIIQIVVQKLFVRYVNKRI